MHTFAGDTILLQLALANEASGFYPLAYIYDANGTLVGSAIPMTDGGGGLYHTTATLTTGYFTVKYLVYTDVNHTARSPDHLIAVESITSENPARLLDIDLTTHTNVGSVGEAILSAFAQAGGHVRDDTITFDANNRPTAFRRRVFATEATAAASTAGATGEGEIMTFTIAASHLSADKWQSLLRRRTA